MKKLSRTACGLLLINVAFGADPGSLEFRGGRIGVPPLSLSESIAKGATTTKPFQFGTGLPSYSDLGDSPNLSPNLVPRPTPNVNRPELPRSTRLPHVSRSFGMPIIEPGDAVDYRMTIVPPNPTIDFKLVIKDPTPAAERKSPE